MIPATFWFREMDRDSTSYPRARVSEQVASAAPPRSLLDRPDLKIVLLRGNVDTRVRKVSGEGRDIEAEAAVLAAVGLQRLGMERVITEYLEPDVMLPAVGQGFHWHRVS